MGSGIIPMTPGATISNNPVMNLPNITMEHRWGERFSCRLNIWIDAGAGPGGTGRLRNVSLSGAFLETALDLSLLAQINVGVVREGAGDRELAIPASVVRRDRDGVGVEWCETPKGSICKFLGCTTRCAASTVKPGAAIR